MTLLNLIKSNFFLCFLKCKNILNELFYPSEFWKPYSFLSIVTEIHFAYGPCCTLAWFCINYIATPFRVAFVYVVVSSFLSPIFSIQHNTWSFLDFPWWPWCWNMLKEILIAMYSGKLFCRLRFSKAKIASGWQRIISKACLDSLLLSSLVDWDFLLFSQNYDYYYRWIRSEKDIWLSLEMFLVIALKNLW